MSSSNGDGFEAGYSEASLPEAGEVSVEQQDAAGEVSVEAQDAAGDASAEPQDAAGDASAEQQDAAGDTLGDGEEFTGFVDEPDGSIAEIVYEADPVLLAAVDQARAALTEITPAETIGDLIGHEVEGEHVLSLFFASKLAGYPDWHWTATLARVGGGSSTAESDGMSLGVTDDDRPTVLEVELLPGEGSVLSPAWVPWADRLTADAIVDDSESEFDDDIDDESGDEEPGDDDTEDDLDDDDDDDDDDGDDDSDDLDDEEVAALALRRDRDGIDIDTLAAEAEAEAEAEADGDTDADTEAEAADLGGDELGSMALATSEAMAEAEAEAGAARVDAGGVDADAGSAFDETDDFTDAGDIEGRDDDDLVDRTS